MYLFIVNSDSGNKCALTSWKEIESLLIEQQIQYEVVISESQQATQKILADKQKLIKTVGIIGGDGTINSVIQVVAETNIPIAIFPTGSGNDTAKMFQLTDNPQRFVQKMLDGESTVVDLIKINGQFGMTVAGTGLDAAIGNRVNQAFYKPMFNRLGIGAFSYILATIHTLLTFKPFNGKLTIDGYVVELTNAWLIACGNTSSYGGGLKICPQAHPTDGILNITHLHKAKRLKILFQLFPLLLQGKPVTRAGVFYNVGKEIIIETDRPLLATIDGEITISTPLRLSVREKALRILLTT